MSIRDTLKRYEGRETVKPKNQEAPDTERPKPTEEAKKAFRPFSEMTLSDFSRSGSYVKVRSRILGEDIWFVADRKTKKMVPDSTLVSYTARELRSLIHVSPEDLLNIHRIKKTFDGEIEN